MNNFTLKIAFLATFITGCTTTPVREPSLAAPSLHQLLHIERKSQQLPSVSLSIGSIYDSKINNYQSGNINSLTKYSVASLSKTYVATIILLLEQNGKLSINDPITKYLPQYTKWQSITINQCLTHTSNITEYTELPQFWQELKQNPKRRWNKDELIRLAYNQKGTTIKKGYKYTNTEYEILAKIIEKASHLTYKEALSRFVINPIGLKNTVFIDTPEFTLDQNIAEGYNYEGTFPYGTNTTRYLVSSSIGSLFASSNDVVVFLKSLFSGKLLNKEQLNKMKTLKEKLSGSKVLIGHNLNTHWQNKKTWTDAGAGAGIYYSYIEDLGGFWSHAGGNLGYESIYTIEDKGGMIAVTLTNGRKSKGQILQRIHTNLLKKLYNLQLSV